MDLMQTVWDGWKLQWAYEGEIREHHDQYEVQIERTDGRQTALKCC